MDPKGWPDWAKVRHLGIFFVLHFSRTKHNHGLEFDNVDKLREKVYKGRRFCWLLKEQLF
jgi:hypothetical protein